MGKYGFLVKKHEFFLKKPILLRGLEKLRRQSDNLRHTGLKLDKNPYLDKEYFDLRKHRLSIRKTADEFETIGTELNDCFCI